MTKSSSVSENDVKRDLANLTWLLSNDDHQDCSEGVASNTARHATMVLDTAFLLYADADSERPDAHLTIQHTPHPPLECYALLATTRLVSSILRIRHGIGPVMCSGPYTMSPQSQSPDAAENSNDFLIGILQQRSMTGVTCSFQA